MEKSAKPSPMAGRKRSISDDADMSALHREWDEVSCPICMDHPHNAVLLICNSYEKGCRSYICDTSYRHSNCFDRFRKLSEENTDNYTTSAPTSLHDFVSASTRNFDFTDPSGLTRNHANHVEMAGGSRVDSEFSEQERILCERFDLGEAHMERHKTESNLRCPLCRGRVLGWKVLQEARVYLNLKTRMCSRESCSFSGNYRELRHHARRVHPSVFPAEIDPSRQQAWQHLEEQRMNNDIVTAIRSSMPGAMVLGDYVIDGGDTSYNERDTHLLGDYVFDNGSRVSGGSERWLSTFFLFHLIGSMESESEGRRGRSRGLARHRRQSGPFSRRRHLWGERLLQGDDANHEEEEAEAEDHNETDMDIFSDTGEDVRETPRRRRRLVRSTSD